MISEKQLLANQKNALKSTGPRTARGKAIAASNSLKHGLLAKEVVITEGEGAEDQKAFDVLLADLVDQLRPIGSMEEILVEKIAVCYWRLGRANRYEVGVLRQKLDTATADYYEKRDFDGQRCNETDVEIDEQIKELQESMEDLQRNHKKFVSLGAKGASLEKIYDDDEMWEKLYNQYEYQLKDLPDRDVPSSQWIKEGLNRIDFSDDQIWDMLIKICEDQIHESQTTIEKLQKDKVTNKLRLSAIKKSSVLPSKLEMDTLLRYETAIERQLYRAIYQLERQQRRREGDYVPAPVQVDLNINDPKMGDQI